MGLLVILPVVAEDGPAFVEMAAVTHELVPEIVPDLMAEMSDQRAIGLVHELASLFTFRVVRLAQRDRDHAVVVSCHDLRAGGVRIVREEVEDQRFGGRLRVDALDEAELEQGIEEAVLRSLDLCARRCAGRHCRAPERDGLCRQAAHMLLARARIDKPVADAERGVSAKPVAGVVDPQRGPGVAYAVGCWFERAQGRRVWPEPQRAKASLAAGVFEEQDLRAALAGKQTHERARAGAKHLKAGPFSLVPPIARDR